MTCKYFVQDGVESNKKRRRTGIYIFAPTTNPWLTRPICCPWQSNNLPSLVFLLWSCQNIRECHTASMHYILIITSVQLLSALHKYIAPLFFASLVEWRHSHHLTGSNFSASSDRRRCVVDSEILPDFRRQGVPVMVNWFVASQYAVSLAMFYSPT